VKHAFLILLVTALAAVAGSCGPGSEPAPTPEPSPTATTGTASPSPTASADSTGTEGNGAESVKIEPPLPEPEEPEPPIPEPKLVRSQWLSIFAGPRKVAYEVQNLYEFPDGGRRLQTTTFLKLQADADRFTCARGVIADVDAQFRPRRLEFRALSSQREWYVIGRLAGGDLVLTRTAGKGVTKTRIPITGDVTFLSWAIDAAVLSGTPVGMARRWTVIDESLGAALPDPCSVQMIGPRTVQIGSGRTISGQIAVRTCGLEQVAYVLGTEGRTLRCIWQSTPRLGEPAALAEAQQPYEPLESPLGPEIEGFSPSGYKNATRGFSLWVPPTPIVAHAVPDQGAIDLVNLSTDARLTVRLAALPQDSGLDATTQAAAVADLLQRQWAARFEEVKASEIAPGHLGLKNALVTEGTARLGCTPFTFRNFYLTSEGRTYAVSICVPDRAISTELILMDAAAQSLRLTAPEGPVPLSISGDTVRSPFLGIEVSRPNNQWILAQHLSGSASVIEMGRQDQAALALVRVLSPRPGQTPEEFAADQAALAVENIGVTRPQPKATTLAGRKAAEITYEGKKILSDRSARCTIVYAPLGDRMLALFLIADAAADASVARELDAIRESLKISAPAPREKPSPTDSAAPSGTASRTGT
jgi:hypothetical protein